MEKEIKKYRARIYGELYSLMTDESEETLLETVRIVDGMMREIAEKAGSLEVKKIAVLAALKVAAKMLHMEKVLEDEKQLSSRIMNVINLEEPQL